MKGTVDRPAAARFQGQSRQVRPEQIRRKYLKINKINRDTLDLIRVGTAPAA